MISSKVTLPLGGAVANGQQEKTAVLWINFDSQLSIVLVPSRASLYTLVSKSKPCQIDQTRSSMA
jgi:hypothetical protein